MLALIVPLSACDLSELPGMPKRLSETDSKAIGAACRHAGRALEDCFTLNPDAKQAGVFEGWRDMNDYMASNKIEVVAPKVASNKPPSETDANQGDGKAHADASTDKPSKKTAEKGSDRSVDKLSSKVAKMAAEGQGADDAASEKSTRKRYGRKQVVDKPGEDTRASEPVADKPLPKTGDDKQIVSKPWQRKRDST